VIAIVQSVTAYGSSTPFSAQFTTQDTTAGNAIIAILSVYNSAGSGNTFTVEDTTHSANLTQDAALTTGGASSIWIGSLFGITGGSKDTVQVTASEAVTQGQLSLLEVSGLLTNGQDILETAGSSSATACTIGPYTPALASELYISALSVVNAAGLNAFPLSGYTDLSNNTSGAGQWDQSYKINTSGVSAITNNYGTLSSGNKWSLGMVTYEGASIGYSLSASFGPFSITGQAASFSASTSIPSLLAACGTYNISLASASSDFDLISAYGSYAYVGIAASLVPVYAAQSLIAAFGSYSIAAQNALLVFAQPTPAPAGPNIIPLMVGIFYEQAVYLLEQLNIYSPPTILSMSQTPTVTVNFIASNQIPGIVLAQSLATGTPAPLGTPVTLTVSEYPMAQDVIP
jgi:hypothetical protein